MKLSSIFVYLTREDKKSLEDTGCLNKEVLSTFLNLTPREWRLLIDPLLEKAFHMGKYDLPYSEYERWKKDCKV